MFSVIECKTSKTLYSSNKELKIVKSLGLKLF